MTVVSLAEERALRELETTGGELPREEALGWARMLFARYGGEDDLTGVRSAAADVCDDCAQPVVEAWSVGRMSVCRRCACSRLRVARQLDGPAVSGIASVA